MTLTAPTILTVDDESSVRRVIRTVLEREGYQVREAANGVEALEAFRRDPEIQLVVSDMRMPEMDGNALGVALRKIAPAIKILFVSAFEEELVESLRQCPTLCKPFTRKQLVTRVEKQLNLSACA